MSLLEDVFLEDEAGEAQELERVIEGYEYDERPISPNSDENEEKEDEAEEDKRRVDPTQAKSKRVVRNPRFILNPARLTGPRGIQVIPEHFKDFKFKGKGHEKEDLDLVLKKLEHWAYRLYPKFEFKDCLRKIETLGKKRPVMVHLTKIRSDQLMSEETVVQKDSSDDEAPAQEGDEFDKLLQQQIELARSTPAPGSVNKPMFTAPSVDHTKLMPKATASPSISEGQKERMLRNKRLAEERRLAKLKKDNNATDTSIDESNHTSVDIEGVTRLTRITDNVTPRKHNNRSNVIDSSDEEDEANVNSNVIVDVHSIGPDKNSQNDTSVDIEGITRITDIVTPRNHSRSNVINNSDEEEANVNSNVIVDVHSIGPNKNDQHGTFVDSKGVINIIDNVTPRKHNCSNVIDSSDEEDEVNVNSNVIVDAHSITNEKTLNGTSVDIEGVTRIADNITPIKQNRSNVIDISDKEKANVNSIVIVDVHSIGPDKNYQNDTSVDIEGVNRITDNVTPRKQNRVNVIDSSDEEEANVNSSVKVDLHSISPNKNDRNETSVDSKGVIRITDVTPRNHNRLNIIDISDGEEANGNSNVIGEVYSNSPNENDIEMHNEQCESEATVSKSNDTDKNVINEYVSKDIPKQSVTNSADDVENADINSIVDSNENNKIIEKTYVAMDDDNIRIEITPPAIDSIENSDNVLKIITDKNTQDKEKFEMETDNNKNDRVVEVNKENIGNEIMDVDFDDDF